MTKKNKDKITFDKRGFKNKSLSQIMPSIMGQLGSAAEAKKSASLIRLINHWPEIIGKEMAVKTAPVRIHFKQQKNRETGEQEKFMVLKLKAESAIGTHIAMRETIILDRLNRLFGTDKFRKLDIVQGNVTNLQKQQALKQQKHYNVDLPEIDDLVLKSRLESLGQAVMNDAPNKEGK